MGVVLKARQTNLNRLVALKVMHESLREHSQARRRTEQEAVLLARVDHPNVVPIHDVFDESGSLVLVLELVTGGSMRERIDSGPMSFEHAIRLMDGVLQGLEAMHEQKVVHRDLKPANILLDERGRPKITDLGVARDEDGRKGEANMTRLGAVIGTPEYMSPEQAIGAKGVDHRSDLFSAGIVFFEMMTRAVPFSGDDTLKVRQAIIEHDPDWTLLPQRVPSATIAWLKKTLAKNPEQRFQSAQAMRSALAASLRGESTSRPSARGRMEPRPPGRHPRAASRPAQGEIVESWGDVGQGMDSTRLGQTIVTFVLVTLASFFIAQCAAGCLSAPEDSSTAKVEKVQPKENQPEPEPEPKVLDPESKQAAVAWFNNPVKGMCPEALRLLAKRVGVEDERDFWKLSEAVAKLQQSKQLETDGMPGKQTLEAFFGKDIRDAMCESSVRNLAQFTRNVLEEHDSEKKWNKGTLHKLGQQIPS